MTAAQGWGIQFLWSTDSGEGKGGKRLKGASMVDRKGERRRIECEIESERGGEGGKGKRLPGDS